jgi:ribosome recycling factor
MSSKIIIVENNVKSFSVPMEEEMSKTIKHFESELVKIRTGRAHTSMVEDLPVSCYGQPPMALKGLAAIAAADARLITIQPWDASTLSDIQKAIMNSDLGLTPINDGKMIKIQLPEMSSTRREELSKILIKKLNACKEAIKSVRKDFNNYLRDAKKDKLISEDFFNRLEDVLQQVTDKTTKVADTLSQKKEKDLMTI